MAAEPLPPPDATEGEEGGGPVKPFLEHLEDLRWTIIKVLSAVVISMIVCLVAGNRIVELLKYPLVRAKVLNDAGQPSALVRMGKGGGPIGRLSFGDVPGHPWSNHPPSAFNLTPVQLGTNWVLALVPDTNRPSGQSQSEMVGLKNYGPLGGIVVGLKLALYGGLSLAAPFVMLFIGQFVVPALRKHEKRFVYRAVAIGVGLFIVGVVFCYFIIMQITLLATVQFSQWLGFGADEWRAEDYVDFVLKMMLAVGLSFQLPVILLTLVKIGILDYEKLRNYRAYFIVGNMVACALITPSGDPFTMLLLAIPVQALYELSVFVARAWWRRDQRELAAVEAANRTT
jgi:sec-independent protein translocase protein TatC